MDEEQTTEAALIIVTQKRGGKVSLSAGALGGGRARSGNANQLKRTVHPLTMIAAADNNNNNGKYCSSNELNYEFFSIILL